MTHQRIHLGQKGEDLAVTCLKERGYEIIERNARSLRGEIDIIARDGETICFVEVKTRTSDDMGLPVEAISIRKQKKIVALALGYLKLNHWEEMGVRFDVVSVLMGNDSPPQVELIQNAFWVDY